MTNNYGHSYEYFEDDDYKDLINGFDTRIKAITRKLSKKKRSFGFHNVKRLLMPKNKHTTQIEVYLDPRIIPLSWEWGLHPSRTNGYNATRAKFDRLLVHDETYLSKWHPFITSLRRCDEDRIANLSICHIELTEMVCNNLLLALTSKRLKEMLLWNNRYGASGTLFVVKLLTNNDALETLRIVRNPITSLDAASQFAKAVMNHASLSKLTLVDCGVGLDTKMLGAILSGSERLTHLDLRHNFIPNSGATIISDFLSSNASLECILLDDNEIGDEGVLRIASALQKNSTLRHLHLSANDGISECGIWALIKLVFDDTTFRTAFGCNHICSWTVDSTTSEKMGINVYPDAILNRREKIHRILHNCCNGPKSNNEGFDFKYLENMPVELMPNVLTSIQQDSMSCQIDRNINQRERRRLSMIFEILRGWDMPLIYSYCSH